MWEEIVEVVFYVAGGLVCLAVAGWTAISGQLFTMDGLFLALICLTLAAVFFGAFALGVRSGDFDALLRRLRRKSGSSGDSSNASSAKA